MKVSDIMTKDVIRVSPQESVEVAARALAHYNIGALPVCGDDGKLCGMVTDRDLVIRCVAANLSTAHTTVGQVMTGQVLSVKPDTDASVAAHLMGRKQIRRLPVTENGKLCGMVTLGDMALREESVMDAADALSDITKTVR
ncbi:MAG: CBS domain-containing protein [Oscillospiraceae bacterium]|nr:CBS domain-containing protein [Oscillospiraceae bacterium]